MLTRLIAWPIYFVVEACFVQQSACSRVAPEAGRGGVPFALDHHPAGDEWTVRRSRLDSVVAIVYGISDVDPTMNALCASCS